MKILQIGCGFLGSLLAEELFKRNSALKLGLSFVFCDYDAVEARNTANQLFTPKEVGIYKATCLATRAIGYQVPAEAVCVAFKEDIDKEFLDLDPDLIISAVDSVSVRVKLWKEALRTKTPLLDIGLAQEGIGRVSWFAGLATDTTMLNPVSLALIGMDPEAPSELTTLPPCELIAFRGVGLNLAVAGAKAVGIWLGMDPEKEALKESTGMERYYTTWEATPNKHSLLLRQTCTESWEQHAVIL